VSSPRIFVSYMRTEDERGAEIARQLIADLQANGAEIVTDNETISDAQFMTFLNRELPRCQYLILVQTPAALKSLRVQTAVNMALTMAAQNRIRNVLRLIAIHPDGKEAQPQWSAERTFDASTDYPRARDKLFLELDLLKLDEHMSLRIPYAGPPSGKIATLGSNLPPTQRASGPVSGAFPSAPSNLPPARRASGPASGVSPASPAQNLPGSTRPSWSEAPSGIQPSAMAPGQPPTVVAPFPPINQGPGQSSLYQNPAPAFTPASNYALPGESDHPSPLERKRRFIFPVRFSRPFRTLQTRISAQSSKPSIDKLETLLEDRPAPLNTTRKTIIRVSLVVALILVLALGTTVAIAQVRNHLGSSHGKHSTPTASHAGTPGSLTPAGTASTVTISSTASVTMIDPRSTVDPYVTGTTLKINDDLTQNDSAVQWQVSTPGPNGCSFKNNAYDMVSTGPNYCLANQTNFSNFVYQIQMKIVQGTTAGVVFRANNTNQTYYYFQITTDGHFSLWRSDAPKTAPVQVPQTTAFADAINKGPDQANLIAIMAIGDHIVCFVNGVAVVDIHDGTHPSGNIGVMVGQANNNSVTEATYQFAKVWIA
jgi:Domain of Unknown Function (DUF1080)/TIR domain